MFKNKSHKYALSASQSPNTSILFGEDFDETETEAGTLEIIGTGEIRVRNTGGSSASEGGMGSDSDNSEKAKGDLTKQETGTGKAGNRNTEEDDITFDPIKKNVREAEKKQSNE